MKLGEIKPLGLGEYCFKLHGLTLHLIFEVGSLEQTLFKKRHEEHVLFEARHVGEPLGGQYSALLHKAHIPSGQDHLHLFARQNQLAALNKDGTAHDASHGVRLPNRVVAAIQAKFPEFKIPPDGLIEAAAAEVDATYQMLFNE